MTHQYVSYEFNRLLPTNTPIHLFIPKKRACSMTLHDWVILCAYTELGAVWWYGNKRQSLLCVNRWSLSDRRLPFQQDVEYGNTTSHLGDCDGRLQHYDMDASAAGCVLMSEGRLHLVAQHVITSGSLSLSTLFRQESPIVPSERISVTNSVAHFNYLRCNITPPSFHPFSPPLLLPSLWTSI